MKIDLGEHWSIVANHYGNPVYYFSTYGQAVKCYIKIASQDIDATSFEELGAFIDDKLKDVQDAIDSQMKKYLK